MTEANTGTAGQTCCVPITARMRRRRPAAALAPLSLEACTSARDIGDSQRLCNVDVSDWWSSVRRVARLTAARQAMCPPCTHTFFFAPRDPDMLQHQNLNQERAGRTAASQTTSPEAQPTRAPSAHPASAAGCAVSAPWLEAARSASPAAAGGPEDEGAAATAASGQERTRPSAPAVTRCSCPGGPAACRNGACVRRVFALDSM